MCVPYLKCVATFVSRFMRATPEGKGITTLLFLERMRLPVSAFPILLPSCVLHASLFSRSNCVDTPIDARYYTMIPIMSMR